MPDLDDLKMNKIKEFAEKAELTGKPASAIKQSAAASKPKDAGANKAAKAKVVKPEQKEDKPKVIYQSEYLVMNLVKIFQALFTGANIIWL